MDINKAKANARALLMVHGLRGWTVVVDNAKRRAGQCDYRKREISLSRPVITAMTEEETRLVVLHEIAHALTGPGHGHDGVWRRMCINIGGDGKRCHTTTIEGRYMGTCPNGHVAYKHRMSKAISDGSSCGKCTRVRGYNARFAITWVDTMVGVL